MSKLEINILTNEEGTGAITFDKGLGVAALIRRLLLIT